MASIVNYVANGTHSGSKENIWVQIVFFINVGSGQVTGFDSFKFLFQGAIKTAFFSGSLDLSLELTDHNAGAMSGPCAVSVNGTVDNNAKYHVDGNKLVLECNFSGTGQTITLCQIYSGKQTQVDLSGQYNYAVHLDPA
jgi:hypothetical protein